MAIWGDLNKNNPKNKKKMQKSMKLGFFFFNL